MSLENSIDRLMVRAVKGAVTLMVHHILLKVKRGNDIKSSESGRKAKQSTNFIVRRWTLDDCGDEFCLDEEF